MLWDPGAAKVVGIAGSGRSPRSLTLETVRSRLRNGFIPPYGALPVSVPGTVDMWWTLPGTYGKLKWAELFEPALAYAEGGVPVPPVLDFYMISAMHNFPRRNTAHEAFETV